MVKRSHNNCGEKFYVRHPLVTRRLYRGFGLLPASRGVSPCRAKPGATVASSISSPILVYDPSGLRFSVTLSR